MTVGPISDSKGQRQLVTNGILSYSIIVTPLLFSECKFSLVKMVIALQELYSSVSKETNQRSSRMCAMLSSVDA